MNIEFDNIIFSLQKSGGISLYWSELINFFLSNTAGFDVFYNEISSAKNNFFRENLAIPSKEIIKEHNLIFNRLFPVKNIKATHLFHSSYYRLPLIKRENIIITTIHDFIPELFQTNFQAKILAKQKYLSMKNSNGIICVSENTKNDLLKIYPEFSKKNIEVIHNGTNKEYKRLSEKEINNAGIKFPNSPYSIYVGKRDKYKNFEFAVELCQNQKNMFLVIVGGGNLNNKELSVLQKKIGNKYIYYPYLTNRELNYFYNKAEYLIYPSSYEGFGIPIVEAQKSGCPIIALNTSSIKELVKDKNLLMQQLSINEAKKVNEYIQKNKEKIIEENIINAKQYTWEKSMNAHIDFYNSFSK